jgi:RNA polymerase sigma-70 factor, ECF subfamily
MADRGADRNSEERLVARLRGSDPEAVHVLYQRFGPAIFTVGYKALGDRNLAEEVVQLTFLKAWQAADTFDPARPLAPWLYSIARRTAIDLFRREARHAAPDHEIDIAALPPSFEELWEVWEVRSAVDRLPDAERQVVEAMHYRDLTLQETADELGIPLGTVKSRSHRAHGRLAALLGHVREVSA